MRLSFEAERKMNRSHGHRHETTLPIGTAASGLCKLVRDVLNCGDSRRYFSMDQTRGLRMAQLIEHCRTHSLDGRFQHRRHEIRNLGTFLSEPRALSDDE